MWELAQLVGVSPSVGAEEAMKRRKRLFGLTGAAVLSVVLIPASPVLACSCAEVTVTEISDQEPDAVAARIRRVDEGGSQACAFSRGRAR